MAFVNEKILEADMDMFNSFNLKSPFTRKPIEPWMWTIDRERDIVLVEMEGQGYEHSEIPMFYALVWKKNVIIMETFSWGKGNYTIGAEIWWKIRSIRIPESLIAEKDTIIKLIKEAFDAYGSEHKRAHVKKVNFEYIATPFFMPEVK